MPLLTYFQLFLLLFPGQQKAIGLKGREALNWKTLMGEG